MGNPQNYIRLVQFSVANSTFKITYLMCPPSIEWNDLYTTDEFILVVEKSLTPMRPSDAICISQLGHHLN